MTKKQFENAYRKYFESDLYDIRDAYNKPSQAKIDAWGNRSCVIRDIAESLGSSSIPKIITYNKHSFSYAFICSRKTDNVILFVVVTKYNVHIIEEEKLPKIF